MSSLYIATWLNPLEPYFIAMYVYVLALFSLLTKMASYTKSSMGVKSAKPIRNSSYLTTHVTKV